MIVANDVSRSDSGFDSTMGKFTILSARKETPLQLELMPKQDAAHRILDEIVTLRSSAISNSATAQ